MKPLYNFFHDNKNIINSEQFSYSKQIMQYRLDNELSVETVANYLEITNEEYLELEYYNTQIPVDKYQEVLAKLQKMRPDLYYTDKEFEKWLERNINDHDVKQLFNNL